MSRSKSSDSLAGMFARRSSASARRLRFGAVLAAAVLVPVAAHAQSPVVPVSITVAPVLYLSSSGSFSFSAPSDADYTTGYVASSVGPTLTHRANVPYKITIQAQSGSTLSFTAYTGRSDANPNKPVGDLTLRATTGGTAGSYVGVGAAGSPGDFISRGSKGATLTSTLDARLALSYANDPPGTYSTNVVFTIVAQ